MNQRRCLVIPFLIGQREDAIIGNSCATNPTWGVPCNPADLTGVACQPGSFLEDAASAVSFAEDLAGTASLSAPTEIVVSL